MSSLIKEIDRVVLEKSRMTCGLEDVLVYVPMRAVERLFNDIVTNYGHVCGEKEPWEFMVYFYEKTRGGVKLVRGYEDVVVVHNVKATVDVPVKIPVKKVTEVVGEASMSQMMEFRQRLSVCMAVNLDSLACLDAVFESRREIAKHMMAYGYNEDGVNSLGYLDEQIKRVIGL